MTTTDLTQHRLTCRCPACRLAFPDDRVEVAFVAPEPTDAPNRRRLEVRVPLGAKDAPWPFIIWLDPDDRLLTDFPGFPGTFGARLDINHAAPGGPVATGTRDPALAALADPVPLRRLAIDRVSARCMAELGLGDPAESGLIPCPEHGEGLPALTCRCLATDTAPRDAVVLYNVDGDYPDLFCPTCLTHYAQGDLDVVVTVCSRCQQRNLYRHHLVNRTWYGALPGASPFP